MRGFMKEKYYSLLYDFVIAAFSLFLSFLIENAVSFSDRNFLVSICLWPFLVIISFYVFKIYSILWRFSRFFEMARLLFAIMVALIAFFISQKAVFNTRYSFSVYLITFFLTAFFAVGFRAVLKASLNYFGTLKDAEKQNRQNELSGNIMIIGGGNASSMIINEIFDHTPLSRGKIKCVIDDDPQKQGNYIAGIRIVGGRDKIIESAQKYDIDTILFAIPSCSNKQKSEILNICQQTDCELKIIPSIYEIVNGNLQSLTSKIRKVEIEDLLGREPIDLQVGKVMDYVAGRVVLVTGGGGTIGSELCRQIAAHHPKQLIIFDIYENNAYDIQNELRHQHPALDLVTLIGSVRDSKRLDCVFAKYHPQIIYHAAAHKHVPLMEDSPNETIKNNVIGTLKTARCADQYGAEKFVLISTDKAVNPTNIMGASKRMCEMVVQTYNNRSKTEVVAVRFGNVRGSNGSVIPLFKKQIKEGGPVTVTDPDIIRYFMTIPEAVTLVLQAGATAKGGEIFVLDMGKPVKILTLAENLIKLSGLTPYKDIKIEFIGLRPGEKLYEEMLMAEEGLQETENKLIHIGKPIEIDEKVFLDKLDRLIDKAEDNMANIRKDIKDICPTYNPNNEK
ncbi:MAG: polysaccharide biosynthesis protein [Clostridia bacterium]|nr:polysaccharide biosynthesis protein [Clostridia bacterium]